MKFSERTIKVSLALFVSVVLVVVMALYWNVPPDYYCTFLPAARSWLYGQTRLYDEGSGIFLDAPWMLGLIVPFSDVPFSVGQIAINMLSMICILTAVAVFWDKQHFSAAVLAVANLPVLFLLNNGQIDGVLLLGITVGYLAVLGRDPWLLSAAFVLLLIKPPNILLPALLFAYSARKWSGREWLKVLSMPLAASLAAFGLAGLDWPLRYLTFINRTPSLITWTTVTTIWRSAEYLNVPFWLPLLSAALMLLGWVYRVQRAGLTQETLSLALATNLILSPYVMEYHYVLLIPSFLLVAQSPVIRWLAYVTMFLPLLRYANDWGISWVMLGYPIILLAATWGGLLRQSQSRTEPQISLPSQ